MMIKHSGTGVPYSSLGSHDMLLALSHDSFDSKEAHYSFLMKIYAIFLFCTIKKDNPLKLVSSEAAHNFSV